MTRRQCAKCPWKTSTDPYDIPGGYTEERHRALGGTIRTGPASLVGDIHLMACHETSVGGEAPCVGWLANQLGPGNNLGLRWAVIQGQVDADVELDGPQHDTLEDTFPNTIPDRGT